jgi:oligoribonuclease NrnB/cAMP/cGMP phosphodiesterase (DHH superfamily)
MTTPFKVRGEVDVCIYHDPCSDGFGSAFAVWKKFRDKVQYVPASHYKRKPVEYWLEVVKDKRVIVCDFSFERDLTEQLHKAARSFQVLDHHASSVAKGKDSYVGDLDYCYINQEHSGAMLTWLAFHAKEPPWLIKYVEDQDIWKFELWHSEAMNIYIESHERSFGVWDSVRGDLEEGPAFERCLRDGRAMLEYRNNLVDETVGRAEEWLVAGERVVAVNSPVLRPQVAHQLVPRGGFGGSYWIQAGNLTFSLRSDGSISCSKLALCFKGGGGHEGAAGFTVPIETVDFKNRVVIPPEE